MTLRKTNGVDSRRHYRFVTLVFLAFVGAEVSVRGQQRGVAYLELDLNTGAATVSEHSSVLDRPVLPGSVVKIAALAAALESGIIDERSVIRCSRDVVIAGHRLSCTHPDLHRPLGPAEALAHSCNVYLATVAARLPRSSFDRALSSLGLPPSDPHHAVVAAALGIEGVRVSPRRLLSMMTRVATDADVLGWRPSTLALIRNGLRGAAQFGTAAALANRGVSAMAKTGTTVTHGISQGLVIGVTPASTPTTGFVLLVAGAAGVDAAALAADRLRRMAAAAPRRGAPVRIGIAGEGAGYTVRTLSVEEYVAGVVAGEAVQRSRPAALEALAITARTFALANRGRHKAEGFDLCDLTHCQVQRPATPATRRAASATAGRVLLDHGAPADVYYTASCGGHTERPSVVWPGAVDRTFLPSVPDTACDGLPAWTSELPIADLTRALKTGGFKGDSLRGMTVTSRSSSGRVAWLRLDGLTPHEISGEDLRTLVGRTLGWQQIRSTRFDLRRTGSGVRIQGRGAGHGVGLCVIGSSRRAARGESADAILASYFPGLSISNRDAAPVAAAPALTVLLPDSDRHDRSSVTRVATRMLGRLVQRLDVTPPAGIEVRFHPTVESYQRATGQPWFTAGAARGSVVHLIPLSALRTRRILESTLAHELVHVLTADILANRPLWAVEGVASFYSEMVRLESAPASKAGPLQVVRSAPCPPDSEFSAPASQDALRAAYARAAACVRDRLDAGQSWRNVK